jgi:hypothetical protein
MNLPDVPRDRPVPTRPVESRPPSPKSRFTTIREPDWQYFSIATYATSLTIAMVLRGSPVHGWLAANLKPMPTLGAAILLIAIERGINHLVEARMIRCVLRPPAIIAASLAATTIFYYSQV